MSAKYCLPDPVFHFWPKLTHSAARSLCDSWATCLGTSVTNASLSPCIKHVIVRAVALWCSKSSSAFAEWYKQSQKFLYSSMLKPDAMFSYYVPYKLQHCCWYNDVFVYTGVVWFSQRGHAPRNFVNLTFHTLKCGAQLIHWGLLIYRGRMAWDAHWGVLLTYTWVSPPTHWWWSQRGHHFLNGTTSLVSCSIWCIAAVATFT